ncbi:MAG: DUF2971 domain-containing protein [Acidobacteriota bacterium]|nr:DUF2971 domain-containing protein [Acidobacteriota bacterium]
MEEEPSQHRKHFEPAPSTDPPVLYKYYPPKRLDVFDTRIARFTAPTEFNDAFDSYYDTPAKEYLPHRSRFRRDVGIFCLTEDPNNHLMWVHYAEQHKGFVLGFATQSTLFADAGRTLRKVTYEPLPPQITFEGAPPLTVSCCKSREWIYEKEWRCVQRFTATASRDVIFDPMLVIKEVIIGSAMTDDHLSQILLFKEMHDRFESIKLSRSVLNRETWTIGHSPLSMRLCLDCGGTGFK